MKLGMQAWGSEGDLRPFVTLARALGRAGHRVELTLCDVTSTGTGTGAWSSLGLDGVRIREVPSVSRNSESFRQAAHDLMRERLPVKQIRALLELFLDPIAHELYADAERLCRDNDAVIGHFLVYPLAIAAARAQTPRISLFTAPTIPSRDYVPAGVPYLGHLGNRLAWKLIVPIIERLFGPPMRKMYVERGVVLPDRPVYGSWMSPLQNLVAVSPTIFPKPTDWPAHVHVCGAMTEAVQDEAALPEDLERFLDAGKPPVLMTVGSMIFGESDISALTRVLVDAALLAGERAVIQSDWDRVADVAEHPEIYRATRLCHARVMPRCWLVVHHGGAGTTHTATRAGCPSVVIAYAADQLFWAVTLERLGVAPRPLRRVGLRARALSARICHAAGSRQMQTRATELAAAMQREDAAAHAMALIETALRRA